MKRLMTIMMALAFLTATVGVSFGHDEPTTKSTKKGKKKKKTDSSASVSH